MEGELNHFEGSEKLPEVVKAVFDTKEEAEALVKEFWEAMSFGKQIIDSVKNLGDDWSQELTMGDRTTVSKGGRDNRGKFIVNFRGNHQPLSAEAGTWLKEKGLISN
jgi:hypothetical protein